MPQIYDVRGAGQDVRHRLPGQASVLTAIERSAIPIHRRPLRSRGTSLITIKQGVAGFAVAFSVGFVQPAQAATKCPSHFAGGVEPVLVNAKPARESEELCSLRFAVLHSGVTRTPVYVAEYLTRSSVAAARGHDERDNRFHPDRRLPSGQRAEVADYVRSGFDRGHMAPSGDMVDAASDYESFSLANIVPQAAKLNRNSWADLENYARTLMTRLGAAYVVTGPSYKGSRIKALNGRVLVPTSTWKALYVPGEGAGAWIATNTASPRWRVISIAELTRGTGVDPFPSLDAATKAKVPAFPIFGRKRSKRGR